MHEVKYYEVFLTGETLKDTAGNPVKDDQGKIKVQYTRVTNPSVELLAKGLTKNNFFQVGLIEVNVGASTMTVGNRTLKVGPVTTKGRTESIFENKQPEIFKAIVEEYLKGNFTVIVAPEVGKPVVKINDFVIPGLVKEFDCGFDYVVHTRNKETHIMEPLIAHTYDEKGRLVPIKNVKRVGQIFLFANEVPAVEAHVMEAINELRKYELKPDKGVNEKTEQVLKPAETPAGTATTVI